MYIKLTRHEPINGNDQRVFINFDAVDCFFLAPVGHWEKNGKKLYPSVDALHDAEYVVDYYHTVVSFGGDDVMYVKESPDYIFNVLNGETP